MEEDNPVTGHGKLKLRLVAAGFRFRRHRESGWHTRMRHVRFNHNLRVGNRFASSVGQSEANRSWADPHRLRRDFVVNRYKRCLLDRS